jgi:hypothetical protein
VSNLDLWEKVEETDTKFSKTEFTGGRKVTSITPMYQIKNATKMFGIYGIGWGVIPESVSFTEREIDQTILLNYDAVLFYKVGDEIGKLPLQATEKLSYVTKSGKRLIDHEARKKVATNALTKGLSMLGFNADVFMGMFEDQDYVNTISTEQDINRAENKEEVVTEKNQEIFDYIKSNVAGINNAPSDRAANSILNVSIKFLSNRSRINDLNYICLQGIAKLKEEYAKTYGEQK